MMSNNLLKTSDFLQLKKFNKVLMKYKPKKDPKKKILGFSFVPLIEAEKSL